MTRVSREQRAKRITRALADDGESESELERTFDTLLLQLGPDLPPPVKEYVFHPTRQWRFDRAWPMHMVAVELEGGIWQDGRHVQGNGFIEDCWKYSAAASGGWKVLRATSDMLRNDPVTFVALVRAALAGEVTR